MVQLPYLKLILLVGLWFFCTLLAPVPIEAASPLSFTPIEEAKFLIKGGWIDTSTLDLVIDYDTTYLVAPEATIMGGLLQESEHLDATSGRVLLRAINNGQSLNFEICLFFQKKGQFPAIINFVTAEATGPGGRIRPVPVVMKANPNLPKLRAEKESEQMTGGHRENAQ